MRMRVMISMLVLGTMCWIGCDDDDDNDNNKRELADADERFVERAALSNLTEIDFGTLAASKGNSQMVRDFGQHMVDEHTLAQNELKALANNYDDIDWPGEPDPQHKQIKEQLVNLTGESFDSLYMVSQVADHEMTLSIFQSEIDGGKEQSVKDYANKYHPHIQEHLEKADSILTVLQATTN